MKYIIEMPDGWDGTCDKCPLTEYEPDGWPIYNCQAEISKCPLAKAKKAVEITTDHMETYQGKDIGEQSINGKPVKLWATEDNK